MSKKAEEFKNRPNQVITRRPDGSIRVRSINDMDSKTRQEFKEQSDVNKIMAKYRKIGIDYKGLPEPRGQYVDLTEIPSYEEAQNTISLANQAFAELPAQLRKRFQNDPNELMAFLSDEENRDEAIKLGLVYKPEPQPPTPIPVQPSPAPQT